MDKENIFVWVLNRLKENRPDLFAVALMGATVAMWYQELLSLESGVVIFAYLLNEWRKEYKKRKDG